MKPLKLTLTAFGPYKDKEVIDFEELENNRLFVISGKTGAGKTTIFDGISFALYGAASGEDRESDQMLRSDFAHDDVHTSVELLFELNGEVYRILRQLGHVKQGNKTATGDQYEFVKIKGDDEEPCVDRQIVSEINKRVEELVGLTKEQFRQIVMLPQGEFRKLLTSKTENKEEILRRIFKTEDYQKLNEHLRQKKEQAQKDSEEELNLRNHYINEISAKLPNREESLLFQVVNQEFYNVNQVIAGMDEEKSFYQKRVEQLNNEKEQLSKQQEKVTAQYHEAKSIHEKDHELQTKRSQLVELEQQGKSIKEKKESLELAEKASQIEPYERQLEEIKGEVEQKQQFEKQLQEQLLKAKEALTKAETTYNEEKGKETDREKAKSRLQQLEDLYPKVQSLKQREEKVKYLAEKLSQSDKALKQSKENLQKLQVKKDENQKQINEYEGSLQSLHSKQQQLHEEREKYRLFKNYIDLLNAKESLVQKLQHYGEVFETKKKDQEQLEQQWIESQAAILAHQLHDGEACPVCGSLEHPNKQMNTSEAPSKHQLEALRKQVDEAQANYSRVEGQLEAKKHEIEQAEDQIRISGESVKQPEQTLTKVHDLGVDLANEVKRLTDQQQQLDQIKEETRSVEEQIKQVQEQKEQHERHYYNLNANHQSEERAYYEHLEVIPKQLRSINQIEAEIESTKTELHQLQQQWEQAQKALEEANKNLTTIETSFQSTKTHLEELKGKRLRYEEIFKEKLDEASFEHFNNYQQSKKAESERQTLKREIDEYRQSVQVLSERIKDLEEQLEGKEKPDLEVLEEQLVNVKKHYEEVFNQYNVNVGYLEDLNNLRKKIEQTHEAAAEKEKKLNQLTDLYNLVRGQNEQKLSFERYLQIEYLEQIIEAANERLRRLSNGQYYLVRSNRQEARGRQSGLGLDVFDAYTGQARDVKSLSGGEKFNASLCLALGMSDVIQSFQGGVSIETMFIDEGFGSLDDESLNKAIDTLIDLQKSGRMIGVISHVQELKAAIPAILEVKKTKDGHSETEFVVN
ncbi:exonuclease SbcC [Alkalibacillus filiformis]|uniref:Nuclease SbcCD subunit C n=1 Tax=Alkalibacillus filiformis TaxID=200990 RepID=A0ABU0DUC2_9BACI|nr:AAA family ATPase [Alkalibacillus filiformis]MDQ0352054.1 exonuclease SbcC [Alkalibacillus filiformis]